MLNQTSKKIQKLTHIPKEELASLFRKYRGVDVQKYVSENYGISVSKERIRQIKVDLILRGFLKEEEVCLVKEVFSFHGVEVSTKDFIEMCNNHRISEIRDMIITQSGRDKKDFKLEHLSSDIWSRRQLLIQHGLLSQEAIKIRDNKKLLKSELTCGGATLPSETWINLFKTKTTKEIIEHVKEKTGIEITHNDLCAKRTDLIKRGFLKKEEAKIKTRKRLLPEEAKNGRWHSFYSDSEWREMFTNKNTKEILNKIEEEHGIDIPLQNLYNFRKNFGVSCAAKNIPKRRNILSVSDIQNLPNLFKEKSLSEVAKELKISRKVAARLRNSLIETKRLKKEECPRADAKNLRKNRMLSILPESTWRALFTNHTIKEIMIGLRKMNNENIESCSAYSLKGFCADLGITPKSAVLNVPDILQARGTQS